MDGYEQKHMFGFGLSSLTVAFFWLYISVDSYSLIDLLAFSKQSNSSMVPCDMRGYWAHGSVAGDKGKGV